MNTSQAEQLCPQCEARLVVLFFSVSCPRCELFEAWRRLERDPRWRGAVFQAGRSDRMRRVEGATRAELFERVEETLRGAECWATRAEPLHLPAAGTYYVRLWVGTCAEYEHDFGDGEAD